MSTISENQIISIVDALYENAAAPDGGWIQVFNDISRLICSGPGALMVYGEERQKFNIVASTIAPEFAAEYENYYQFISPFKEKITSLKPGESFSRMKEMPDDDFEKTEIYQGLFKKQDVFHIEYHCLSGIPGLTGGVAFSRPKKRPLFSAEERQAIDMLLPHLKRAIHLHLLLSEAQRQTTELVEAFSSLPQGVIILSESGKIAFANPAAERLLSSKDGLRVNRSGLLDCELPADGAILRATLDGLFGDGLKLKEADGAIKISRPSSKRPLQLLIRPFHNHSPKNYQREKFAICFVSDPETEVKTAEDVLCQLYGFTPTEARLAATLAQGHSIQEAGAILGVSLNTVRTHLKHVFAKTETNRQADLIKLILKGPASYGAGR